MRVIISNDRIIGHVVGDIAEGVTIPADLVGVPIERLAIKAGNLVDAASLKSFYVDEHGRKYGSDAPGRVQVTCRWDDALVRDNNGWRVRSAADQLAEARTAAMALVVGYADRLTARITAAYPAAEVASWPVREAEARSIVAGEALPEGALLTALAAAAGQTPAAYAARILAKAAAYRQIVVAVTVIREAAQAAIAAATTPAEIEAALAAVKAQADQRAQELGLA